MPSPTQMAPPPTATTPPQTTRSTIAWQQLVQLGDRALAEKDFAGALQHYDRALEGKPDNPDLLFKLAQIHMEQNDPESAKRRIEQGLRYRDDAPARVYLGYLEEVSGNFALAAANFRKIVADDAKNLYALTHLGLCQQQSGQYRDAIKTLETARSLDPEAKSPDTQNLENYIGLAYEGLRDHENAVTAYERATQRDPNNAWTFGKLGALYDALGEPDKAKAAYERAYILDPTDAAVRQRITDLAKPPAPPETESSETAEAAQEPVTIAPVSILPNDSDERIRQGRAFTEFPDANAVILLNRSEHDVLPDGRSRFTTHQIIQIRTMIGLADYGEIAVPFNSTAQNIGVNVARTVLPDGTTVEAGDEAFHDVTPPESLSFNLYSDTLWKVISLPALRPGAVIEYQVTVEDAFAPGDTSRMWFWGGMTFQTNHPTLLSQYALRTPQGVNVHWKAYNCSLEPTVRNHEIPVAGGNPAKSAVYSWEYGKIPAWKGEKNAPSASELVPRFAFSSVASWDDLDAWYRGLLTDRLAPDETITAKVTDLIGNLRTQEQRIQALAHFVTQDIRYAAIQLGEGAYQPHTAKEVLHHRYGDCKDKVALLVAMLRVIGVDAYPVLISPSPDTDVDADIPSIGQFSHMIVAIPTGDGYAWYDPTTVTMPFGKLPARDQGRRVFVVKSSEFEWTTTPVDDAEENRYDRRFTLTLEESGKLTGRETVTATGTHAGDLRESYRFISESDMKDFFADAAGADFPGARVTDWNVSPMRDLDEPVTTGTSFEVETAGTRTERTWAIPLPDADFASYGTLVVSENRRLPLELGIPNVWTQKVVLRIPEGYETVHLPEPLRLETPFGQLTREYQANGREVGYSLELRITTPRIAPERYSEARRLFLALAQEAKAQIFLVREPKPTEQAAEPSHAEPSHPAEEAVEPPTEKPQTSTQELTQPESQESQATQPTPTTGEPEPTVSQEPTLRQAQVAAPTETPKPVETPTAPPEEPAATQEDSSAKREESPAKVEEPTPEPTEDPAPSETPSPTETPPPKEDDQSNREEPSAKTEEPTPQPTESPQQSSPSRPLTEEEKRLEWLKKVVSQRIEEWERAWESRQLEALLGFYDRYATVRSATSQPDGTLKWSERRRSRFAVGVKVLFDSYAKIQLDLQNVRIGPHPEGMIAIFDQTFQAWKDVAKDPVYRDVGKKYLIFVRDRNSWTIRREVWEPIKPSSAPQ